MGRFVRWLFLVGAPLAIGLLLPAVTSQTALSSQTCRSPVAYSNGVLVSPPPSPTPSLCAGTTGYGGAEARIVITADDTAVYEPAIVTPGLLGTGYLDGAPGPHLSTQASPGGLAVSTDAGATWQFDKPAGNTWVPQDDQLYADRTTGWLYYYALSPDPVPQSGTSLLDQMPAGYAHLMASPDDGKTWYYSALPGYIESENPRFTSAAAPTGQQQPVHYAAQSDVVYWCGNNMLFVEQYRACYRSLDGGVSWSFASILFTAAVPQHKQCGTNGESFADVDGNYPEGAPDGSLWVLVHCGNNTFLARSTDEGATWPIPTNPLTGKPLTAPANGELRIDNAGNLYLGSLVGNALELWTSTDGGETWSAPHDVTVPGSSGIIQWFMAEHGIGEVAMSYVAHTGTGKNYDGYVALTGDALASSPLFWGTTVDDPATPLVVGSPPQARDDFVGVDIGPDGVAWASFYGSCRATDADPACVGQSADPLAAKAVFARLSGVS